MRPSPRHAVALAGLVLAVLPGTAACTAHEPRPDPPAGSASPVAVPDDAVRLETFEVALSVPAGWTPISRAGYLVNGEGVHEASRLGVGRGRFLRITENLDAIALGERPWDRRWIDRVSILHYPGRLPAGLAADGYLLKLYDQGMEGSPTIRHVETAAGPTSVVDHLVSLGTQVLHGRTVLVNSDDQIVAISVEARDPELADRVRDLVLASVVVPD